MPQMPDAGPFDDEEVVYTTGAGIQAHGDSRALLAKMEPDSVDLIMTSPPFALQRKKAYGNESEKTYADWLAPFGVAAHRVLKDTGSLVIDLGGAYQRGVPVRSLYNYRVLLKFCDDLGYHLAQEFFWHNPAKLPSPIEWVNKRKIRAKDSVNTVWWLSKTEWPKANIRRVLQPYSSRMKNLLDDPDAFYQPGDRPSEHSIGRGFGTDNGGAIPPNLLQYSNTDSNGHYLRTCKAIGETSHPARFPAALPRFFVEFLTDPGDLVVDIFSGSNTTGEVAEQAGRRWMSFELDRRYASLSAVRFMRDWPLEDIATAVKAMQTGESVQLPDAAAT